MAAWTGDTTIDLTGLKESELNVGGVGFRLLNPPASGNRAVIGLRVGENAFAQSAELVVERKAAWVYLLHTGSWMAADGAIGTIEFIYADGSRHSERQVEGQQMAHFITGGRALQAKRVRLDGEEPLRGIYAYASFVGNPFPNKVIKALRFLAETENKDRPIWMLLAVSLGGGRNLFMRPRGIDVKVDATVQQGRIRRLNGTNLGPSLQLEDAGLDIVEDLRELNIPLMRLHDAPWEQGNFRLVDVPHIFPLFHADHKEPMNYFFPHTDDYIARCLSTGAKILYRLGVTIEHSKNKYFTFPPKDYVKWSEICCNIIAHYNEGWADGFRHGIEYWEIWCEPDLPRKLWNGTWDEYVRLYVTSAKMIKSRFPNVKIGGPSLMTVSMDRLRNHIPVFLEACRREGAPLDFFTWHCYSSQICNMVDTPFTLRRILDSHGFNKTELVMDEWHYSGGKAFSAVLSPPGKNNLGESRRMADQTLTGHEAAAFACAGLSAIQDTPIDMANYYTGSMAPYFGIFDIYGGKNKCYHALSAFNRMTKHPARVKATVENGDDLAYALAGLGDSGELSVLISCPFSGKCRIKVDVAGFDVTAKSCETSVIDSVHDLTPSSKPLRCEGSKIIIEKPTDWSVFLLEFGSRI